MAVKFIFWLSDEYFDRLCAIKEAQGKQDMTLKEFAKEILEKETLRLHPAEVVSDPDGLYWSHKVGHDISKLS